MKPVSEMTQPELAAYVHTYLTSKGIDVVLSGGAVVVFYTSGKYVSRDIDFVNRFLEKRSKISESMEELGFQEIGRQFEHPDTELFVEFPPGPLSIGEENIVEINEIKLETGLLRLISPTDCVKDRLAWFFHENDRQCLAQATLVANEQQIDIGEIREWSKREGKLELFEEIKSLLES